MNKFLIVAVLAAIGAYFYSSRDGFDPETIRDKRVLITGSSSGIGEQMAYEYSKLGARLMLTARRQELLDKVALKCRSLGAREVHVLAADMGASDDRIRLVKATEKALGGLDQLILNHADLGQQEGDMGTRFQANNQAIGRMTKMLNTNFISFVDLTSQFLNTLKKSEARVAIVSSIAGKMAILNGESYAASKHALHGFYSSWRQDLRHQGSGVSFTLCVLGPINTQVVVDQFTDGIVGAASVEDTAIAILRATTTRAREMYFGPAAAVSVWLHKFFPEWVEDKGADYFKGIWEKMHK